MRAPTHSDVEHGHIRGQASNRVEDGGASGHCLEDLHIDLGLHHLLETVAEHG